MDDVFVHRTALVESEAIGKGTRIWAFVHVLPGAAIGANCNIGDHSFVESGARIGDDVTVKNGNASDRELTFSATGQRPSWKPKRSRMYGWRWIEGR